MGLKLMDSSFLGLIELTKPYPYSSLVRYEGLILVVIGVLCVPWMLFVKPIILKKRNDKIDQHHVGSDEIELVQINTNKDREHNYNIFVEEEEVSLHYLNY